MRRHGLTAGTAALLALAAANLAAASPPTVVRTASSFGVSRPVAEVAVRPAAARVRPQPVEWERENEVLPKARQGRRGASVDGALAPVPRAPTAMPSLGLTFEGLSSDDNVSVFGSRPLPPDPIGDVGPNHYVQMVNTLVGIYSKAGVLLVPFFAIHDLFDTIGPPCALTDDGDPIVLYDPLADRWLLSQLCGETTSAREHQLIAVSTTGDPTGTYFVYDFILPNDKFNDYPHFGAWPDAYYMTNNQFLDNSYAGGGAYAFDRDEDARGRPDGGVRLFRRGGDRSRRGRAAPVGSGRRRGAAGRHAEPLHRLRGRRIRRSGGRPADLRVSRGLRRPGQLHVHGEARRAAGGVRSAGQRRPRLGGPAAARHRRPVPGLARGPDDAPRRLPHAVRRRAVPRPQLHGQRQRPGSDRRRFEVPGRDSLGRAAAKPGDGRRDGADRGHVRAGLRQRRRGPRHLARLGGPGSPGRSGARLLRFLSGRSRARARQTRRPSPAFRRSSTPAASRPIRPARSLRARRCFRRAPGLSRIPPAAGATTAR